MRKLEREARVRIQKGFEDRMAALHNWHYDQPGEDTCPACFGTWISATFTNGWERLRCCECGAEGPLPDQCVAEAKIKIIALTLILAQRRTGSVYGEMRMTPITTHRRAPKQKHPRLNVAW